MKPNILLTNDDGYQAAGLRALAKELADYAEVSIVRRAGNAAEQRSR